MVCDICPWRINFSCAMDIFIVLKPTNLLRRRDSMVLGLKRMSVEKLLLPFFGKQNHL